MPSPNAIQPTIYYHIYNRGNNKVDIFPEDRNYSYFFDLYLKYISPVAETFAYCLLRNHFHILVRIKSTEALAGKIRVLKSDLEITPSQSFSNLFNAYTKAFNKLYSRTGSLFQHPFGRVSVETDPQLIALVKYIHRNPEKHGLIEDFREYKYSSYKGLVSTKPTHLERETVLGWFNGITGFIADHEIEPDLHNLPQQVSWDVDHKP